MLRLIFLIKCALERAITAAAVESGKGQPFRKRKLSIADVIQLLIGAEGGSLARELHRAGVEVTASAISQRRAQIPPEVFQVVLARFNAASTDPETFRGYRVLAVDGTSVKLPRNPNAPSFVCNDGASNGYNQLHLNPLFDLRNKTFFDAVIQPEPRKDEIGALIELLKRNDFTQKTLIIGDRGDELARQVAWHTVPIRPERQDQRNLKAKGFVGFTYRVAA